MKKDHKKAENDHKTKRRQMMTNLGKLTTRHNDKMIIKRFKNLIKKKRQNYHKDI